MNTPNRVYSAGETCRSLHELDRDERNCLLRVWNAATWWYREGDSPYAALTAGDEWSFVTEQLLHQRMVSPGETAIGR